MFELSIIDGPQKGHSLVLRDGASFVVGSAQNADLRIGGDAAPEHAAIKPLRNGGFGIKALDSSVVVNGEPVSASPLKHGDQIEIGDARMRFEQRADKQAFPERLGGFEIKGMLGKGGMGLVYRARQVSLDREVALKVLADKHTKDPEFVTRFQAEAKHAARLHHPNVVQVFDVDHDGDTYFYSMELMHAGSVEGRLKKAGRLTLEDALSITLDAARGLAFAKETGLVHRDIKPDNLMVDRHGNVKLADLGLARAEDEEEGKVVGTPHFMPPEQIQRKPLDHRSDLYALGCTLFRMLTGRTPFQGANVKAILRGHLRETPPRADEVQDDVPSDVADIIERMLEKDPTDRYQSAHELIEDIEALQSPESSGPPTMILAIAGVVVLGIVGFLVFSGGDNPNDNGPNVVIQSDPNAESRERELREANADRERLRLVAQLDGEELATALERFAAAEEYSGTEAAGVAAARAGDIRDELAAQLAAEEELAGTIQESIQAFESAVQASLGSIGTNADGPIVDAGRLVAALTVCSDPGSVEGVDASVVDTLTFTTAVDESRTSIARTMAEAITAKVGNFESALADQSVPEADRQLGLLDGLLAAEAGFPVDLYRERSLLLIEQQQRRQQLAALKSATANEREASSWTALENALTGGVDAAVPAILRGDFAAAVERLNAAGAEITADKTRAAQQALVQACTEAGRYLTTLRGTLEQHTFDDADGPRGYRSIDAGPTLNIVLGPVGGATGEDRRIGAAQFPSFAWPSLPAQDRDREMFLAMIGYAEAQSYGPRIVTTLGAGSTNLSDEDREWLFGNPPYATLSTLDDGSQNATDQLLAREFRASRLLHAALRALAAGRSEAGRARLERLLQDRGTLLVRRFR
ncbi:MAG: FHA domain-containing serine/threonine-protein kinase [Planctomycetota bacterium]